MQIQPLNKTQLKIYSTLWIQFQVTTGKRGKQLFRYKGDNVTKTRKQFIVNPYKYTQIKTQEISLGKNTGRKVIMVYIRINDVDILLGTLTYLTRERVNWQKKKVLTKSRRSRRRKGIYKILLEQIYMFFRTTLEWSLTYIEYILKNPLNCRNDTTQKVRYLYPTSNNHASLCLLKTYK